MLANLNDVLLPAKEKGYAVGLFNTCSLEFARGVIEAAEEMNSPVIIGTAEIFLHLASLEMMADMLLPAAAKMTNERLLKDELKTAVGEAKREYFVMLGLVFGNVPLLYLLNKDWFYALTDSVPGQIALALCVLAGLITFLLLGRFARLPSPKGTDARPVSGKSAFDSQNKKNKTVRKEDNA